MSVWVTVTSSRGISKGRLFCLPYAGGGAVAYHLWKDRISEHYDLVQIHLPGRESRLREPPATRVNGLVPKLARELIPWMDRPFAIFGHSMGALIGYELARELRSVHGMQPDHMFVSGFRAPHLPAREKLMDLPDAQFIQRLRAYGGIPEIIIQNPELMEIFLPILRADFQVLDTYTYQPAEPLNCPLTAFGGNRDPNISSDEVEAWHTQTSDEFACRFLPGGHFFINESRDSLLDCICDALNRSFDSATAAQRLFLQ
jgi:medium-chain acyl-[acyl-carrier-protein] hydrolase